MFDISLFFQQKSTKNNITPKPIALSNCNTVHTTGIHDHIFYLNIGENDKCIGIFDGNGENSKDFSQTAGNFCMQAFQDEWVKIRQLVVERQVNKLETMLKNILESTDEYLDIKLSDEDGGCSVLIIGLVNNNGIINCFSTNIGNISCVLYDNENVHLLYEDHSPGNINERIRYCNRVPFSKRKQFVYGTINCYNKSNQAIGAVINTDKYGNKPIPVYQYINGEVSVDKDNIELLNNVIDNEEHRKSIVPTVEGKIHVTRTLGNFKIRGQCHLDTEPSFFFQLLTNNSIIVIGTNSFTNLWKPNDILNVLTNENNEISSKYVQSLYDETIQLAQKDNLKMVHNRYPLWDDIAFGVIKVNNVNNTICSTDHLENTRYKVNNENDKNDDNDENIEEIDNLLNEVNNSDSNIHINITKANNEGLNNTKSINKHRRNRKRKNRVVRQEARKRRMKRRKARNPKRRR